MAFLILRYQLKPEVSQAEFEEWVRTTDQPAMRSLRRVKAFDTYRVSGLLMGEGNPAQEYFELFEIDDLEGFGAEDMTGELVQSIMGAFMGMVDNPEFNIAERIE
jgi:hypothetical protein